MDDSRNDSGAPKEWRSRGYLPHRDAVGLIQFVTFRLADSLPLELLAGLEDELRHTPDSQMDAERRKKIEHWLDSGIGCCALRHPEVADYVERAIRCYDGSRYRLHAWCIMPNHVHVLVEPLSDLAGIIRSWKSYTARWVLERNERLNLQIPTHDRLWMREYWDRYIRDGQHFRQVVDYIQRNPAKAGLCKLPEDWRWSSAFPGKTTRNIE